MTRSLDDVIRGAKVLDEKMNEKIAYLCGIAQQKYNVSPEDLEVDPSADGEMDGEQPEGGAEGGEVPAEGGEVPAEGGEAPADGMPPQDGQVAPDAGMPTDAAGAPSDTAAVVAPDGTPLAQPVPDDQQQQQQAVQEGEENDEVADAVSNVVKTPEDAAKLLKSLQECMGESAKKRFIKACCGRIKRDVDECRELDECAQNAFIKKYLKSFAKGYDELTESDEDGEVTQAELESYIDSLDPEHAESVFEDFVEECGMSEDEIREAAEVTVDDEMDSEDEDERLDALAEELGAATEA